MNRTILKLVLLVSCAHAMAHVYELSLPTVERDLAISYVGEDAQQGKEEGNSNADRVDFHGGKLAQHLFQHQG